MRRQRIPLRQPGCRTPFLRRWLELLGPASRALDAAPLPVRPVLVPSPRPARRRPAQAGRGLQGRPYPVGAIGIPLFDHPRQRPRRLGEPVLQVAPGPADLAVHQAGGLTAQMLPGRPPAELPGSQRRTPASSSVWPTSSAVMKKNLRLSASRPSGLGDSEIQAQQFGGRVAQHVELGLQVAASRASTCASPCSMASLRCWRQASAAVTVSATSRSRPRRSISPGGAARSSRRAAVQLHPDLATEPGPIVARRR